MRRSVSFSGRTAIVTGAGRGMGREHAMLFASLGAKVVVNNRSAWPAEQTVRDIKAAGGEAVACVADMSEPQAGQACVDSAIQNFGQVDIVVNNAGIADFKPFSQLTEQDFDTLFNIHFRGAWRLCKAAWPHMIAQNYGKILMIGSHAGIFGLESNAHYSSAKGAMFGLAQTLAREGAPHNICANTVTTGGLTEMIRSQIDDPHHIAHMEEFMPAWAAAPPVVWLCHEESDATGEYYTACGKRMSQIFQGETRGYAAHDYSVEGIKDHFHRVRDRKGYTVSRDIAEATALISRQLGARDGGAYAARSEARQSKEGQ